MHHPLQSFIQVHRSARGSPSLKHICRCQDLQEHEPCQPPTQLTSIKQRETLTARALLLTGVSDGDEAGAVEEAVPRVPAPGLVVGVHGHGRPRQQAVRPGAGAGALDDAAVALGAGELQVAPQRRLFRRRLGHAPCLAPMVQGLCCC